METLHLCFHLLCILATLAVVQVKSIEADHADLEHRLSVLEATLIRILDKNDALEKRVAALEFENKELRNTLDKKKAESHSKEDGLRNENAKPAVETKQNISSTVQINESNTVELRYSQTKSKRQSNANIFMATVAFTAVVHPPDLQNLGAGQTVIYDKVITNVGDAYHNHTGVFTAPFNGVYVFNFAEMISPGLNEYLELIKNGQHVMWNFGHASGATHYTSSSRTSTLALKAGDEVWVRTSPSVHHGTGKIHGNDFTTFSGWIVYFAE